MTTKRVPERVVERIGPRGGFEYELSRRENGVCMRRVSSQQVDSTIEQWNVFADLSAFLAWCSEDPVVHAEPLLHAELVRTGRRLFAEEVRE